MGELTPPTERQIEYATGLGIEIPKGATKNELSDLISIVVEKDKPAGIRHIEFAKNFGLDCTQYVGKKLLFDRIQDELIKPGNELNMISWFAFRVYRELVSGKINQNLDDPSSAFFMSIAQELISDEKVIKSIKRYSGRDLIWFGEWTSPSGYLMLGGSMKTVAYKTISRMLREKLSLKTNSVTGSEYNLKNDSSNSGKGCLLTTIYFISVIALACLVYTSKLFI